MELWLKIVELCGGIQEDRLFSSGRSTFLLSYAKCFGNHAIDFHYFIESCNIARLGALSVHEYRFCYFIKSCNVL